MKLWKSRKLWKFRVGQGNQVTEDVFLFERKRGIRSVYRQTGCKKKRKEKRERKRVREKIERERERERKRDR